MEQNLLTWKERLEALELHGTIKLLPTDSDKSVYSAINDNAELFKDKVFSVRRDRTTKTPTYKGDQYVMRIK